MRLETERLVIRNWRADDLEAMFAMYSNPNVTRFLGQGSTWEDREITQTRLNRIMERDAELGDFGFWACTLKDFDQPMGAALLLPIQHSPGYEDYEKEFEIGWHLDEPHWGKGLGTEIAIAMRDLGLQQHEKLIAIAYPENVASLRIMQKLGMREEGATDRFFGIPNLLHYSISRS